MKNQYNTVGQAHQFVHYYSFKEKIWLWHRHLGHPPFSLLQKMFPMVLYKVNVSRFHCEKCGLDKHHRVPYPISKSSSFVLFAIINSDIWGPSRVTNVIASKLFVAFIDDYSHTT